MNAPIIVIDVDEDAYSDEQLLSDLKTKLKLIKGGLLVPPKDTVAEINALSHRNIEVRNHSEILD